MEIKDLYKRDAKYDLQQWFELGSLEKVAMYGSTMKVFTSGGFVLGIEHYEGKAIGLAVLGAKVEKMPERS